MADLAWEADQFERHRAHLRAVAYRMLSSVRSAAGPPGPAEP